jgi:sigma-B regulation protein RsbU (phosphoserine phosphatase)
MQTQEAMALLFEEEATTDSTLLDSAASCAQRVLQFANELNLPDRKSIAANHLAMIYAKMRTHPDSVLRYARMAFHFAPPRIRPEMALDLANVFVNLPSEQWDSAHHYFDLAYAHFAHWGDRGGQARVKTQMAALFLKNRQFAQVLALQNDVLRLYQQANDSDGIALALSELAFTHLSLNDAPTAVAHYAQAATILEHRPASPLYAKVCLAAADLLAGGGNWDAAYRYLRKYVSFRDSLMLSEHALALAEMEARFHSERQQRQIEALEGQAQMDEERLHRQAVYLSGALVALLLASTLAAVYSRLSRTRRKAAQQIRAQNSQLQQAYEEIRAQNDSLDSLNQQLQTAYEELNRKHRLKQEEIEEAKRLVESMLPPTLPAPAGWELAVRHQPASDVGGDYYDYAPGPNGQFTLAIGDATGHSLHAAFIVATAKSHFIKYSPDCPAPQLLEAISRGVRNLQLNDMFLALALLRLGPDGRVEFTNAAMPPLLWYHAAQGYAEWVEHYGFYLGSEYSGDYSPLALQATKGDVLLALSDGLAEAENPQGEMLGYDRISEWAARYALNGPKALIEGLLAEATEWLQGQALTDDATLLALAVR